MADSTNNDIQTAQVIPSFFNEFEGTVEEFKELLADLERVDATEEDKKLLDEINRGQVFIYTTDPNKPGEREGIAIYTRGAFFNTEGGDANDFISSDKSINIAQEGKKIDLTVNSETVKLGDGEGNDQSIKVTNPIGNLKMNDVLGEKVDLLTLLKLMLQKTEYPVLQYNPSITIRTNLKDTYEVGQKITDTLSYSTTPGSFIGKYTGTGEDGTWDKNGVVSAECEWSNIKYSGTGTTETGTVDYTFKDDTPITLTVTGSHTKSNAALLDSIGQPYTGVSIAEGTKNSSTKINAYYNMHWGLQKYNLNPEENAINTFDELDALYYKRNKLMKTISDPEDSSQRCVMIDEFNTVSNEDLWTMIIALPVGWQIYALTIGNIAANPDEFTKQNKQIENEYGVTYNVFVDRVQRMGSTFKITNIKIKRI